LKKAIVIGSGFAGLSAASFLAQQGWKVEVIEKNDQPGGRGRKFTEQGFVFDMGPSWYWMPDVFDRYFNAFGKKVSDYYTLQRLDPSYSVYFEKDRMDIPANYESLRDLFESIETGAAKQLDLFLEEAAYKYRVGIDKLVHKPSLSLTEFIDKDLAKGIFRLDVFTSMKKHIRRFFSNEKLIQLLEFPVLFLGALPADIPALYSLMNHADIKLGTWYPQGGMHHIGRSMHELACSLGVNFYFNHEVTGMDVEDLKIKTVNALHEGKIKQFQADVIIGGADYHHIETKLLSKQYRSYSDEYWEKRTMAPSCLLYYVGINKRLKNATHHSLFFDVDFDKHGKEIYTNPSWPSEPLFYVSVPSVTDPTVAPEGCENLFFLIPVAAGLAGDDSSTRDRYFDQILSRYENRIGESVRDAIVYKRSYAIEDFKSDYHAFKGNAYGLANTLMQTAILKPSLKSKKIKNLYFTGQLTVPGPGVPPSLISGEVVAKQIHQAFNSSK
jgi:phytoene desaturase